MKRLQARFAESDDLELDVHETHREVKTIITSKTISAIDKRPKERFIFEQDNGPTVGEIVNENTTRMIEEGKLPNIDFDAKTLERRRLAKLAKAIQKHGSNIDAYLKGEEYGTEIN